MGRLNETRMSAVLDERIGGTFMSCVSTVLHATHATTVVALHAQRQGSLQTRWQQVGGAEAAWLQIGWQ